MVYHSVLSQRVNVYERIKSLAQALTNNANKYTYT